MLILPGLALAQAMNSGPVLAGTEALTTINLGTSTTPATGAISRMKLKLSLSKSDRADRRRCIEQHESMTIGGRSHDSFHSNIAACARPVIDDEWLAEPFR